ncbi:MAG: thiamine pyrophosphate-binding protein [Deltaproteobacteria bacterium]|nr:thiamine pyrophosphate-binding protein [Deltaproteobacteria bacterium]
MMHGGRIVAEQLKREGVTHLFTLCGGHIQSIYDGCIDMDIRVVDVRHEQTAGHAADGWARVTGVPGVVAVTAGPGVTDVVTALANAQRANVPLVCLGGAGPALLSDRGSLQDMNHLDLIKPITKACWRVLHTDRLAEYVSMAFRVALSGVPGPTYLELPLDVLMNFAAVDEWPDPATSRTSAQSAPDPKYLSRAISLLESAERPVAIIGSQLRWSEDRGALERLIDRYAMPTYVNGMARGSVRADHPCLFSRSRRVALEQADVVLMCGTPFDFRVDYGRAPTWNPATKIIKVDRDATTLGHNKGVDVGLVSDTGLLLEALTAQLPARAPGAWVETIRRDEDKRRAKMQVEIAVASDPPNPLRVCAELNKFLQPDSIVVGDGGDFVATAAYVLTVRPEGFWMDPGPLGTLGVGPGYAMAAKLARPDSRVVLVFGDGSFGLHAMELEAMARQKIPVVCVIGNDAGWTQIRRGQVEMYGEERAVATALEYTRYDKVAEALGCYGVWVERTEDLAAAFAEAFRVSETEQRPAVVNVKIASSDFRKGSISV